MQVLIRYFFGLAGEKLDAGGSPRVDDGWISGGVEMKTVKRDMEGGRCRTEG
jgi:hypothetical protein